MSDGNLPDENHPGSIPEPTSVMPVTPGAAGTPPVGPPPEAPPLGDGDGDGSSQPPWVIPAIVGIIAIAIVLLALILTRGGDDDDALPAVDTTTTTIAPETTIEIVPETTVEVTTTSAPETSTTIAPETTVETTTTVAPETTVAPTTTPPTTTPPQPAGPAARPVSDIGANTASLATVAGEQTFAVLGTCTSTPTVGLQAISSVLANESGTVYVVDVYLDEGGEPFVEVADMTESIAGFIYGQDTPGNNARWSADVSDPNVIDQVTMVPLDGSSDPISLSMNSDGPTECGRGFIASSSPFPEAGPIDFVDQFDPTEPGEGFAVLAACDDNATYITSGGGLIDIFFATPGDEFTSAYFVDVPTDSTFWMTPDEVTTNQQIVFQNGGGGDTDYATQVVNFDNDDIGYLSVRIQPTIGGGLNLIDCPA